MPTILERRWYQLFSDAGIAELLHSKQIELYGEFYLYSEVDRGYEAGQCYKNSNSRLDFTNWNFAPALAAFDDPDTAVRNGIDLKDRHFDVERATHKLIVAQPADNSLNTVMIGKTKHVGFFAILGRRQNKEAVVQAFEHALEKFREHEPN